jgi:hypothetical protein
LTGWPACLHPGVADLVLAEARHVYKVWLEWGWQVSVLKLWDQTSWHYSRGNNLSSLSCTFNSSVWRMLPCLHSRVCRLSNVQFDKCCCTS